MKRFNLLFDKWIPVKTNEGKAKTIKAYEITKNDVRELNSPRPDFNAALMQFLISLLQTVMAPKTPREWRRLFNQPPSQDELKFKFESIKPAFYLDGEGYLFMQDKIAKKVGNLRPVEEILFGAPGESGKEKNTDHFLKKNSIGGLCYSCSATALFTSNVFAEDGGRGYFQSMRGNGFVSNLVQLDETIQEISLWKNIWLNILETKSNSEPLFYWTKDFPDKPLTDRLEEINKTLNETKLIMKKTKDNDEKEKAKQTIQKMKEETKEVKRKIDDLNSSILPENNELQVYWAWMRRLLLDTENYKNGECALCRTSGKLITSIYKTGKGYKYPKEYWQNSHPFSPSKRYQRKQYSKHNEKYKEKMLSLEMTTNGFPYSFWNDYITQNENQTPAKVVNKHLKAKRAAEQLSIWCFGYAMDSNSPLGWYESKTPLYFIDDVTQRQAVEVEIERYVQSSNKIADSVIGYLPLSIRMAWFGYEYKKEKEKKKNRKPDPFYNKDKKTLYNQPIEIAKCFWNDTEKKFYELIKQLYENANQLTDSKKIELRHEWYHHLKKEAGNLFDRWAFKSKVQTNPQRIAKAHNQLMENLNSNELKQNILGLPKEVKK